MRKKSGTKRSLGFYHSKYMKYYLSNLLKIDLAFIYCFNLLTTEQSLKEKLKKLKKIFS